MVFSRNVCNIRWRVKSIEALRIHVRFYIRKTHRRPFKRSPDELLRSSVRKTGLLRRLTCATSACACASRVNRHARHTPSPPVGRVLKGAGGLRLFVFVVIAAVVTTRRERCVSPCWDTGCVPLRWLCPLSLHRGLVLLSVLTARLWLETSAPPQYSFQILFKKYISIFFRHVRALGPSWLMQVVYSCMWIRLWDYNDSYVNVWQKYRKSEHTVPETDWS